MKNGKSIIDKKYEINIRKKCDIIKSSLDECMKNSYSDEFVCKFDILNFTYCIQEFTKKFQRKHPNWKNSYI